MMHNESPMLRVGLIGFGKAGSAVAEVLHSDDRFDLCWIARQQVNAPFALVGGREVPVTALDSSALEAWLEQHPVDAIVDFSVPQSLHVYGESMRQRGGVVVSAISAYAPSDLRYAQSLGKDIRIMCSPNITLGINFLIMAAKLLRDIAPFADVEILEQHFKAKPEVSGTAKKIAQSLELADEHITSLRLGGIVGHHEVIFGFPYQTVRITHESIKREAFGTGAAFALTELAQRGNGFYSYEDLLMAKVRAQLTQG